MQLVFTQAIIPFAECHEGQLAARVGTYYL